MPLPKQNWEPFLHKNLEALLENYKNKNEYAVFDFDETIVTGDIEEHLMFYMAQNFLYRMSSKEFEEVLTLNLDSDSNMFTLAKDLSKIYERIAEDFEQNSEIHETFIAKLIHFYYNVYESTELKNGKVYPTYLFQGYNQSEMDALCKEMISEMTSSKIEKLTFKTHPQYEGAFGPITSSFYRNLRFNPEMVDLFEELKKNNITAYIVSATPRCIVEGVVKASPLVLHRKSQIFGMPNEIDKEGALLAQISKELPITKSQGKSQTIEKYIRHRHEEKDPLAVFGDSVGDFNMLTDFPNTKMRVLFNRNLGDRTSEIRVRAKEEYGDVSATYFVQGKNYKKSELIPDVESIL